ncbi:MAG: alpha-2-macroglobulin [Tannerella sp.]|jgi:uncharacterized protein YfaS (alpha-2-macroglobulin family)|nr:alpha-2-macroglobulin [Tannerella sp.]
MKHLTSFSLIVPVLCAGLLISSCKDGKRAVSPTAYADYISAYTDGMVSPDATVRIELAGEHPSARPGAEVREKLFSFSPSLRGTTCWVDSRTLEFIPEPGQLKPGRLYNASFALSQVTTVGDASLRTFAFTFRVEERNFVMRITSLDVAEGDRGNVSIRGELRFSDTPEAEAVARMIAARRGGESFTPVVEPGGDAHSFLFTLSGIARRSEDSQLEITASGRPAGIDLTLTEHVDIPAAGPFRLLDAAIVESPGYGVCLTFSDPLSATQDLTGLVRPGDAETEYTTQIQDNKMFIFFTRRHGAYTLNLSVDGGLKNSAGETIGSAVSVSLDVTSPSPQVEFLSSGSIMPASSAMTLPFRAISLRAVELKIIRIYESNVLMFLQDNRMDATGSNSLRRSGRLVYSTTLRLDTDPAKDIHTWENYSIDLSRLIRQEQGALYRVELSFRKEFAAFPCDGASSSDLVSAPLLTATGSGKPSDDDEAPWDVAEPYYYGEGYNWDEYEWEERDNPCHATYYMLSERKAVRNVLASNLGLIVKGNAEGRLWIAVSDITTAAPVQGADVTAYNYQLQPVGSARTGANGFAVFETRQKPFAVVASKDRQKTYLRVADGEEKLLSRFDVGGKELRRGLKGFIYGERGVWRPGDTLHVSFMMEDREARIPDTHPVTLELYNPRGQFYFRQIATGGTNGLYAFSVPTAPDDPTGLWNAYVKVGGASFHKPLRIETVKPNRLKVDLDIPGEKLSVGRSSSLRLRSAWLTGAIARNLGARVDMRMSRSATRFAGFNDYIFENPASDFAPSTGQVFDGRLDENGNVSFDLSLSDMRSAPGMLQATFSCLVSEPGGDVSIFNRTVPCSPFDTYVGIRFNLDPKTYWLETDADNVFDIVTVNADGRHVDRSGLEYRIYRIGWSWWWDHSSESFASYLNNTSIKPVAEGTLATSGGKGSIRFRVDYPDWGRYLVLVKDRDGGHATGGVIYVDWPDWRGRSAKSDPDGITMLAFSTDKSSYETGEEVTVTIPAAAGARALVAIENGSEVVSREWIEADGSGDTKYRFKTTPDMAPNVYLHISLLQPHAQTLNDLPIRMYGVVPVFVTDRSSVLEPRIAMDDVLRPEAEFSVRVRETNGKPMTYTLAIVDDGLLDLTNFKTPDPWNEFYTREALGIRTWDMYDMVMGAFGGKYGSLFSVGGDAGGQAPNARANRFKPVVKFVGPVALKKGEEKTHRLKLPAYVGSVRVMVVAGQDGAYGNAEKTVPVRTPLMILPSLPRVVSAGEEITLPVNIFAMEDQVKNVSVKVETGGLIQLADAGSKAVTFQEPGDRMVYFNLKTGASTGVERVTVTATGNGHTSSETIEIDVRNPNPPVTRSESRLIDAGESTDIAYSVTDSDGDSRVAMEVSRIPSIEINRRFDFLVDYPHYCSEQLTSSALPLLFLEDFKMLSDGEAAMVRTNVRNAIANLYGRQVAGGGIAYWPGQPYEDRWITSYAGHFLILAKEKGYEVNPGVLSRWKDYQRRQAQAFSLNSGSNRRYGYAQYDLDQAYRLYTLALAGAPEAGAMNRLREVKTLSIQARWRLAAAYALAGKNDVAGELIYNVPTSVDGYSWNNTSYGSPERDEAMILETLTLMGRDREAFEQARRLATRLSQNRYSTTQTVAYALVAMGRLAQKTSGSLDFGWTLNGATRQAVKSTSAVFTTDIPVRPASGQVSVTNTGNGLLYVNVVTRTRPLVDLMPPADNRIRMEVQYTDANGTAIDVARLKQGTDFVAVIRVANSAIDDYTNLALTHIIPSGWEIYNERMIYSAEADGFTYQDIRDDRVLTYFDLPRGTSRTFRVKLMASYAGSFVLPAVQCEAMYAPEIYARTGAGRVTVER